MHSQLSPNTRRGRLQFFPNKQFLASFSTVPICFQIDVSMHSQLSPDTSQTTSRPEASDNLELDATGPEEEGEDGDLRGTLTRNADAGMLYRRGALTQVCARRDGGYEGGHWHRGGRWLAMLIQIWCCIGLGYEGDTDPQLRCGCICHIRWDDLMGRPRIT